MARSIAVARSTRRSESSAPARKSSSKTGTSKGAARRSSTTRKAGARSVPVVAKPARKVTARRRPTASPIARVVTQREAPKATRRFVTAVSVCMVLALGVMFVVVAVQTHIAETQMKIDKINAQIAGERARYDELRLERSSLREPGALVSQATAIGMIPGNGVKFTSVDPVTVAQVLVATGGVDPELLANAHDPLANYGAVKATVGDRP